MDVFQLSDSVHTIHINNLLLNNWKYEEDNIDDIIVYYEGSYIDLT